MEQWLGDTFQVIAGGWEHNDGTAEDAFQFQNAESKTVEAPIAGFLAVFGEVNTPPAVADLKAADPGDSRGWHAHFDAWQAQGLIS